MVIAGLQKTTLLDYPGKLAATIFTRGCNFRCPFCQNSELLTVSHDNEELTPQQVLAFLKKRSTLLEGVCISGGEPTLQKDLIPFIMELRDMGYKIKLDTNGANSKVLEELLNNGLVDYVAMDVKSSFEMYALVAGLKEDATGVLSNVSKSISLLINSNIPYEFRTTLVKGLHIKKDVIELSKKIVGAKRYVLQNYEKSERVLNPEGLSSFSHEEMEEFLMEVRKFVPDTYIR